MSRPRLVALLSIAIVVPLGFGLKFYPGPLRGWVNDSLGGVAYEIFWCLVLFAIWPRRSAITPIVIGVFVATCMLEILQLVDHPVLARIRGNFLGLTLIGTTFVWSDMLYYVIGCALGWLWLSALARLDRRACSGLATAR